jgi:hypothetical protein
MGFSRFVFLVVAIAVLSAEALGQGETTSAIVGQATDATGAVIPGATVTVTSHDTGSKRSAKTDEAGRFNFPQLKPGSYGVRIEAQGFEPQEADNVFSGLGQRQTVNFLLRVARSNETVTPEKAIANLGMQGRILDVRTIQTATGVSDETKSAVMVRTHIRAAIKCAICNGLLDPGKSVSYDHKKPKREQGTGDRDNVEPTHPYCNNSRDSLL